MPTRRHWCGVGAAAAMLVVVSSCGSNRSAAPVPAATSLEPTSSSLEPTTTSPRPTTYAVATSIPATASPTTTAAVAAATACVVDAPSTWGALFDGRAVTLTGRSFLPRAVAPDGYRVFGTVHDGDTASLAELDADGPKIISPLVNESAPAGNPASQVQAMSFDGRWLVWNPMFGDSEASSQTEVLDTQTGERFTLAGTDPFVSQGLYSVVVGRLLWWSTASTGQILHLTTLADRRDLVIATGARLGGAALVGDLVVYVDPAGHGKSGTVHAASATTGAPAEVPAPLRGVQHVADIATSAETVAWTEYAPGRKSVRAGRISQDAATTLFVNADNGMTSVDLTGVTADLVTFTAQETPNAHDVVINGYVARAGGGATVRLPTGYRPAEAKGEALAVVRIDDPRGGLPDSAVVISGRELMLPVGCG